MALVNFLKKINDSLVKLANEYQINAKRRKELVIIKEKYLSHVPYRKLVQIYKMYFQQNTQIDTRKRTKTKSTKGVNPAFGWSDTTLPTIEFPKIEFPIEFNSSSEDKPDLSKIPKIKLISILSKQLSTEQIYRSLIRLGKHRVANNFLNEIELVNKRYDQLILNIRGESEKHIEDKLLEVISEEIIDYLKRLYLLPIKKPKDEDDFHKQIEGFLLDVLPALQDSLSKFNLKIDVFNEFKLPHGRQVDLLIRISDIKIGVEVKYKLEKASEDERLLGQIDFYLPYLDMLLIVSYLPVKPNVLRIIKSKEKEKGKRIKILTPNGVT
ncbi:MAG: hypothetical protein J7L39_01235 [Candidatus Aenigmarchaeota archaeon]|nr:hypothetical protein [Candidatus Aenigmarchaeota archaeon]